jgi:hypothetical protein
MNIPEFNTRKELFDFLIKNKESLIAQKKAQIKHADALVYQPEIINIKDSAFKAEGDQQIMTNDVFVKVIINTTNVVDSHKDLHLPGIWDKSLRENKNIFHIQEHEMEFEKIISSGKDLAVYAKTYSWGELGFQLPGNTQALVFESKIKADRNPFMADQYKRGYVINHSVGMQYVKIVMCINDENCGAEYEAWQKYYPEVANKEFVDEFGYFWAVKEAKVIEGSAVVRGSNYFTPTIEVNESKSDEVKCPSCGNKYNYLSIPESGMGYIKCPNCKTVITQNQKSQPVNTTGITINEPAKTTQQKSIDYNLLAKKLQTIKIR